MKTFKTILLVLVLLLIGAGAFLYFGVYEKGVMAGRILRVSQKGVIFKTYEAKLSIELSSGFGPSASMSVTTKVVGWV